MAGRGKGMTLPAWMTGEAAASTGGGGGGPARGFNEQDQEAIANKFQKLADDRKGRTGLGFSAAAATAPPPPQSTPSTSSATARATAEEKVQSLKASIQKIESNAAASALQRRQLIAHIQGTSDTSHATTLPPFNQHDQQHHNAIFSAQNSDTQPHPHSHTSMENKPFFNRKQSSETNIPSDAPLYKRLAVGDTVYAYFAADGQFHKANIVSVMHGGYHSAQYDVQYHGYPDKTTLSWTDLKPYSEYREETHAQAKSGGGEVDAFGRSLSERDVNSARDTQIRPPLPPPPSPSAPAPPAPLSVSVFGTNSGEHIANATANLKASDDFLQGLMQTSTDINTNMNTTNADGNIGDLQQVHHAQAKVLTVFESPMSVLRFSLDGIVDPAFFANRTTGEWKNIVH